ncbi:MAG: Gfo/Idh/MocA family oxidoreductase [Candidatus Hydrogenedentes bacterium]|nr:Gfo/Idh/MocA family oxidoreductase [Candidatus Hydrogenedentota bacterium]
MTKKMKVGIIGTGAIARDQHLPYWKELQAEGRVEVTALCDLLEPVAQSMSAAFEVPRIFTDYKKMLRSSDFDIIDVCTHNRWHCPITVAALKSGAHVLVEKPMAMNAAECEKMIAAANDGNRTLMVAQHMRFEAPHEKLQEIAASGALGDVYSASAVYLRRRGIPGWGKFHIKKESLGGPLIDIGVHVIDLCYWLIGCPEPISASGKVYRKFGDRKDLCNAEWGVPYVNTEFDVEDYATALVRFEKEITMTVEVSWAANIPEHRSAVTVLGDKAGVCTNPLGVFGCHGNSLTSMKFDWMPDQEGHRGEIRHFVECLEKKKTVRVLPSQSLNVQKIIDAIYASSKKNGEVRIKQRV